MDLHGLHNGSEYGLICFALGQTIDFEGIFREYIANPMDFLDFYEFPGFLKLPPIPLGKPTKH